MRRAGPRALEEALQCVAQLAAPATCLAQVQRSWPRVAGERVAREAEPVAEREGVITVACRSAVWAQELELLSAELSARLNRALGGSEGRGPVRDLRFVTGSLPWRP